MAGNRTLQYDEIQTHESDDASSLQQECRPNTQAKILDYYRPKLTKSQTATSMLERTHKDKGDNLTLLNEVCNELENIDIIVTENKVIECIKEPIKQVNGSASGDETSKKSSNSVNAHKSYTRKQPIVIHAVCHEEPKSPQTIQSSVYQKSPPSDVSVTGKDNDAGQNISNVTPCESSSNSNILSSSSFNVTDSTNVLDSNDLQQSISIEIVAEEVGLPCDNSDHNQDSLVQDTNDEDLTSAATTTKPSVLKSAYKNVDNKNARARRISAKMKAQWAKEIQTNGRLICPIQGCYQTYVSVANFQTHYKWCTGKKNLQLCPYCDSLIFSGEEAVLHHMQVEHPEKVEEYKKVLVKFPKTNMVKDTRPESNITKPFFKRISKKYSRMKALKSRDFSLKENYLNRKKTLKSKLKNIEKTMSQNYREFKKCVRFNDIISKINSVGEPDHSISKVSLKKMSTPKSSKPKRDFMIVEENSNDEYYSDENELVDCPGEVVDQDPDSEGNRRIGTKARIVLNTQGYERFNQYLKLTRDWASERKTYSRSRSSDMNSSSFLGESSEMPTEVQDTFRLSDSLEAAGVSMSVNDSTIESSEMLAAYCVKASLKNITDKKPSRPRVYSRTKKLISDMSSSNSVSQTDESPLKVLKSEKNDLVNSNRYSTLQGVKASDMSEQNYGHIVFSKPNKVANRQRTTCYDNAGNIDIAKAKANQISAESIPDTNVLPTKDVPAPFVDFDTLLESTYSRAQGEINQQTAASCEKAEISKMKDYSKKQLTNSEEDGIQRSKMSKYNKLDGIKLPKPIAEKGQKTPKKDAEMIVYNKALNTCPNEEANDAIPVENAETEVTAAVKNCDSIPIEERLLIESDDPVPKLKYLAYRAIKSNMVTDLFMAKMFISSGMREKESNTYLLNAKKTSMNIVNFQLTQSCQLLIDDMLSCICSPEAEKQEAKNMDFSLNQTDFFPSILNMKDFVSEVQLGPSKCYMTSLDPIPPSLRRKRGRPPKKLLELKTILHTDDCDLSPVPEQIIEGTTPQNNKKKGKKRKLDSSLNVSGIKADPVNINPSENQINSVQDDPTAPPPAKKRRGRPPKNPSSASTSTISYQSEVANANKNNIICPNQKEVINSENTANNVSVDNLEDQDSSSKLEIVLENSCDIMNNVASIVTIESSKSTQASSEEVSTFGTEVSCVERSVQEFLNATSGQVGENKDLQVRKSSRLRKRKFDPDTVVIEPKKSPKSPAVAASDSTKKSGKAKSRKIISSSSEEARTDDQKKDEVSSLDANTSLTELTNTNSDINHDLKKLKSSLSQKSSRKGRPRKCVRYADLNSGIGSPEDGSLDLRKNTVKEENQQVTVKDEVAAEDQTSTTLSDGTEHSTIDDAPDGKTLNADSEAPMETEEKRGEKLEPFDHEASAVDAGSARRKSLRKRKSNPSNNEEEAEQNGETEEGETDSLENNTAVDNESNHPNQVQYEHELEKVKEHFIARESTQRSASKELIADWNKQIETNGSVTCKRKACRKVLSTKLGMIYHYEIACLRSSRRWTCKLCNASMKPFPKNMHAHFVNKHFDVLYDNCPPANSVHMQRQRRSSRKIRTNDEPVKYEFTGLFPEFKPNLLLFEKILESSLLEKYISQSSVNFKICDTNSRKDSPMEWCSLHPFESYPKNIGTKQATFYPGGSVLCAAVCPTPSNVRDCNQYLMLATCTGDRDCNLLQLWDFGTLSESVTKVQPTLKLVFDIECGKIWQIEWCPSGCWESSTEVTTEDGCLPRLGLLAVATSKADITLWSIPQPDALSTSSSGLPHYNVKPVAHLKTTFSSTFECISMSWQKTDNCKTIAGGYDNGFVALWQISDVSRLLVDNYDDRVNILPFMTFQPNATAITSLHFSPLSGGRYLATTSLDKYLKVWDLHDPVLPAVQYRKGVIVTAEWPSIWTGMFYCLDECYAKCAATYQDFSNIKRARNISNQNCYASRALSVISDLNLIAIGDESGEVFTNLLMKLNGDKSLASVYQCVYKTKTEMTDGHLSESRSTGEDQAIPEAVSDSKSSNYGFVFYDSSRGHRKKKENSDVTCEMDEHWPASISSIGSFSSNSGSQHWLFTTNKSGFGRLVHIPHSA